MEDFNFRRYIGQVRGYLVATSRSGRRGWGDLEDMHRSAGQTQGPAPGSWRSEAVLHHGDIQVHVERGWSQGAVEGKWD